MTNTVASTVSVTVGSITLPWNPQGQRITLSAQITGNAGAVGGGTVEFYVSGDSAAKVAVANGQASASYTVPASVLPGTLPVQARFSGWSNYPAATGNGSITIVRRTPVVTWPDPADITQGTPLSAKQLNARADVPGTFVYSPAAGTVLPVGAGQKLSTTFTPSDTVRYTAATAATTITVVGTTTKKPPFVLAIGGTAVREPGTNAVLVTATLQNVGGPAANVSIARAVLNGVLALPVPTLGSVASQGKVSAVLKFPATVRPGAAIIFVSTSADAVGGLGILSVLVP
jgi:hypothetical protein